MAKFGKLFRQFPRTFWVANTMELFERWAWYGLFMVLALYLTGSTDEGALGFTQAQKGTLMGTVTAILYFLPLFTGAIADRVGYKKVLVAAYLILSSGYFMMGTFSSFSAVYLAFLWVAVGAALFKPVISATITKTTTKETSSIGFGIFYMIVNIGGFVGPAFSAKLREDYGWYIVFWMAASAIAVNLILLLLFYKEPEREQSKIKVWDSVKTSVLNIISALKDVKLLVFLVIMIGFWTVFNQLYYTLPNFIDQWVDTNRLYLFLYDISPALANFIGTKSGTVAPEMLLNMDAGLIILLQIIISSLVMKFRPVNAILTGTVVNVLGLILAVLTQNVFFLLLGIAVFAIGEMASSPKYTEYVGRIAPKGKEALYMGTSFLPVAMGNFFAGMLSGKVYGTMSDKTVLLQEELTKRNIVLPKIDENFTQNDFYTKAQEALSMDSQQLTDFLWTNYEPQNVWFVFAAIGAFTVVALFLYDTFLLKKAAVENVK